MENKRSETWLSKDRKTVINYPGQHHMAKQLADHFPHQFKEYMEPFCGKARTAKYAEKVCGQQNLHLSDLNEWAVNYCTLTFPLAKVSKLDFKDVMEVARKIPNLFLFLDPPWCTFPAYVMTNTVSEYYDQVLEILHRPGTVCKWMIVGSVKRGGSRKKLEQSGYDNKVIENDHGATMNGGKIGVRFICNF
jgi:hypothetical protein